MADKKEFDLDKLKYQLATQGLTNGSRGVGVACGAYIFILIVALWSHIEGDPLFDGENLVWMLAILVVGLVIYFGLVFDRDVKITAKIGEHEVGAGTSGKDSPEPSQPTQ